MECIQQNSKLIRLMCCGNKKKPVKTDAIPVKPSLSVQPAPPLAAGQPIITTQQNQANYSNTLLAPGVPAQSAALPTLATNSNIGKSKVPIDQTLQKSQVKCQQVYDPSIKNFFKDCTTQRIELVKITNEHNSYVRNHDYFDVSTGHYAQLNNLQALQNPNMANYTLSDPTSLSTPAVNKFVYDKDIVDVNYVAKNSVYRPKYEKVMPSVTAIKNPENEATTLVAPRVVNASSANSNVYNSFDLKQDNKQSVVI